MSGYFRSLETSGALVLFKDQRCRSSNQVSFVELFILNVCLVNGSSPVYTRIQGTHTHDGSRMSSIASHVHQRNFRYLVPSSSTRFLQGLPIFPIVRRHAQLLGRG